MNNNTTNLVDRQFEKAVKNLSDEQFPDNDLWPEISDSIQNLAQEDYNPQVSRKWMPIALAASLIVTIISVAFSSYMVVTLHEQEPIKYSTTSNKEQISTVELIERPYLEAKVNLYKEILVEDQNMTPEIKAILKKNLEIIGRATQEIRDALVKKPNDQYLTEALLMTRKKEIELLNQISGFQPDAI